jgi:hypothetical protein
MIMATYLVTNVRSHTDYGVYDAEDWQGAIRAFLASGWCVEPSWLRAIKVNVSRSALEALLQEAGAAGDERCVYRCRMALDGDEESLTRCARVLVNAAAMGH